VQVTADLDLNQVTTQEEKFDPDGQVVRSTQTGGENSKQVEPAAAGQSSASANVPGTPGATASNSNNSQTDRNEETTNYEISKTVKTTIAEPGAIKKLSVAVAVDGVTTLDAKGKPSGYTARSADEMKRIEQLVQSAVGYDTARGDQISVINVRFQRDEAASGGTVSAAAKMFDFDKNDIMRGVELLVGAIVSALIIFFVVRPLLSTAGGGGSGPAMALLPAGAQSGGAPGAPGGGGMAQLTHDPRTGEPMALAHHSPSEN